jgi:hypothetical protein
MTDQHKRNHYVPQFMLRYWTTHPVDKSHEGIFVYDIERREKSFARSAGRRSFSFAAANDLYVPKFDHGRAVELEKWLGASESALALLARQAHARKQNLDLGDGLSMAKMLTAVFSLECRSPYMLARLEEAVRTDPAFRERFGAAESDDPKQVVLQNLPNYTHDLSLQMTPPGFTIVHSDGGGVLVGDRPYFYDPGIGQRFFALTNKVILAVERVEKEVLYKYVDAKPDFVDFFNTELALQARSWIAAESEEILDRYVSVVESPEWKRRRESDRAVVEPLEYLNTGWRFHRA